jgi:rare lipoprotein A
MTPARRAAASCAAFGLASLAIGCAPLASQPAATSNVAALTQAQMRPTAVALPAGTRPEGLASEPRRRWVRPSGSRQVGEASYYGPEFTGRKMANGRRFDPRSASVAHRTLPLGTTVVVKNLDNGRSATATVEDRGPFVRGRIIDLSPRLAERLGLIAEGIAPVEVTPVEVAEAPD